MKNILFILISTLLLSSPVIGDNRKGETLYRWGECCNDFVWKGFGDEETHPKYEGDIKDGKPNGFGILIITSGIKYVGEWKDGKENGQGTETWSDGNIYEGEWKDGKRNGQGTLTYSDGRKFIGEFKDGLLNGQGTETNSSGYKFEGVWKDGYIWEGVSYDPNGELFMIYKNGEPQ